MKTETVQKFVELTQKRGDLQRELDEIKQCLVPLEAEILAAWEKENVQSMNVSGMTVYLHRQLWASAQGYKEDLIDSLKGDKCTAWLITKTYNSQRLSAWVRELPADEDGMPILPAHLKDVLKVTERFSVRARQR